MLRGIKNTRPGLAIIEVIMVMVISGLLFIIAIGVFNSRKGIEASDSPRQVMSEIARVRTDAQQGLGATPPHDTSNLLGKEIFGVAIQFNGTKMTVYKLAQSRTTPYSISAYESYDIAMPYQLKWDNNPSYNLNNYGPSYNNTNISTIPGYAMGDLVTLVFKNRTGQSYAFTAPGSGIGGASSIANYTIIDRQGNLKMAFYLGSAPVSATKQYYVNFDLATPNNQSLKVVK